MGIFDTNPALTLPLISKFTMNEIRVTPEIAKYWLEHYNTQNRAVSRSTVKKYAEEMAAGKWIPYGAVIKFSRGKLVNGQHTLNAVIESNSVIRVVVLTGVSDELFTVEDTGKRRAASDVLVIEGVAPWQSLTAAAGIHSLMSLDDGYPLWSTVKYQNSEVRNFYLEHPTMTDVVDFLATLPRRFPVITYGNLASLCYLFAQHDFGLMVKFTTALMTKTSMHADDPVYHLYQWLDSSRSAGIVLSRREVMIATVKSWNLTRAGKKIKSRQAIRVRVEDDLPEVA